MKIKDILQLSYTVKQIQDISLEDWFYLDSMSSPDFVTINNFDNLDPQALKTIEVRTYLDFWIGDIYKSIEVIIFNNNPVLAVYKRGDWNSVYDKERYVLSENLLRELIQFIENQMPKREVFDVVSLDFDIKGLEDK